MGYSPFASERVRGKTEIPKESIYFLRNGAQSKYSILEAHLTTYIVQSGLFMR